MPAPCNRHSTRAIQGDKRLVPKAGLNVGQQLRHARDVFLIVSTDYMQILLLPHFTEVKPVFQRDDAAADEVFEHFKPVMIPGHLTEQLNKGFFVVNHARHASSP